MIGEAYAPIKNTPPDGGKSALWPDPLGPMPRTADKIAQDAVAAIENSRVSGSGRLKVEVVDPSKAFKVNPPPDGWNEFGLDEKQSAGLDNPSATTLLDAAAKHMRNRASTYDQAAGERSMGATVRAFNAITGRDLRESEGWLLLALLKMVRGEQRESPHQDSVEDLVAYSSLYGEARLGGR